MLLRNPFMLAPEWDWKFPLGDQAGRSNQEPLHWDAWERRGGGRSGAPLLTWPEAMCWIHSEGI